MGRMAWIFVGVIEYCFELKGCGGNVSNYLLIYFTQALYVML
jgi:hypothetical protein